MFSKTKLIDGTLVGNRDTERFTTQFVFICLLYKLNFGAMSPFHTLWRLMFWSYKNEEFKVLCYTTRGYSWTV